MRAPPGRALRALLLCVLVASCGAGEALSTSTSASAFVEAELLSASLAALVDSPCGGYAYTFRAERDGARALLAALRVARYVACSGGAAAHCVALDALRAEPDDAPDLAAWSARAAALQSLLHELCQAAAVDASRRDGHARTGATSMLTAAARASSLAACGIHPLTRGGCAQMRAVADREAKAGEDARGTDAVPEGAPQFPPQLSGVASWSFTSNLAPAQAVPPAAVPPLPPSAEEALLPAPLPWPGLAAAGWGELAATREGREEVAAVERRALLDLFRSAGGAAWAPHARARWGSGAHCAWAGVTCGDAAAGAGVVALRLRGAGLAGTLPPGLSTLRSLETLDASLNPELRGVLPAWALALPRLRALALRGCRMGGPLPDAPDAPAELPSLEWLDVSDNSFSGPLPHSWGTFPALRVLNASHNALESELSASLAALPALEVLSLSHNRLRGLLPHALLLGPVGGGPPLRLLDVSRNRLAGTLPAAVGSHATLAVLDAGRNAFEGPPPPPPRGARVWAAPDNVLHGPLPAAALAAAPGLRHLDFAGNRLSGSLPVAALLALPLLRHMNLSGCGLEGALPGDPGPEGLTPPRPDALRALGRLEVLDVAGNALRGQLPPALLRAAPALRHLDVSSCGLSGPLPARELGALQALTFLELSGNTALEGTLPADMAGPLEHFAAARCGLSGRVPLALAQRRGLRHFDVSDNALTWEFV